MRCASSLVQDGQSLEVQEGISRATKQRMNKWVTCGFLPLTWHTDSVDSCTCNEVPADEEQHFKVHIGDREEQNSSPTKGNPRASAGTWTSHGFPAMMDGSALRNTGQFPKGRCLRKKKKKMVVAGVSKQE